MSAGQSWEERLGKAEATISQLVKTAFYADGPSTHHILPNDLGLRHSLYLLRLPARAHGGSVPVPQEAALADGLDRVQLHVLQVEHQLDAAVGAGAQRSHEHVLAVEDGRPTRRPAHAQHAGALRDPPAPAVLLQMRMPYSRCAISPQSVTWGAEAGFLNRH